MSKYVKIKLEFPIHSSVSILYNRISTPGGLNEWFANSVTVKDDIYMFKWRDNIQTARLLLNKQNRFVRFQWIEMPEDLYFEMRIDTDEITGDVALVITDYLEQNDLDEGKLVWNNQVENLKHIIGS